MPEHLVLQNDEQMFAKKLHIFFTDAINVLVMKEMTEDLALVKDILRQNPKGMSITDIAEKIGMNKHKVGRYLDILHASGHVDLRTFGMAKVYTLSSRVPLSAMLSYTTDLVMVINEEFQILQVNDPMINLLDLDKEYIIHHHLRYITVPDPAVLSFFNDISVMIQRKKNTGKICLNSNIPRYFNIRIIQTAFEDGSEGYTLILQDITTETNALEEIKKSKDFFQEMISNLTDGLMVASETECFFVNDRLIEILGFSKDEIAILDPADIAHPNEKKKVRESVKKMMKTPSSLQEIQFWAYKKNKEPVYLHARMSAIPYGSSLRFYVLIADMTEQRRKEEIEYLRIEVIKRAVDQMPRPIYCYREDGVIFLINRAFSQLFGIPDEQSVIGKKIAEVVGPKNLLSLLNRDQDLLSEDQYLSSILTVELPDGSECRYPVEKSPIRMKNGNCVYIFGVIMTDSPVMN